MAVFVAVFSFWQFDRAGQYKAGHAAATAKISADLAQAHGKQAEEVLRKERAAKERLAAEQTKIEKERQNAKTAIAGLRDELGRLQQYAENQRSRANMPKTTAATGASDGQDTANGWLLFGKCAAEYAGVAEVADEQRNDLAEWQAYGRVMQMQQ